MERKIFLLVLTLVALEAKATQDVDGSPFSAALRPDAHDSGHHRSRRSFEELYMMPGSQDTDVAAREMLSKKSFHGGLNAGALRSWVRVGAGALGGRRRQNPCAFGGCDEGLGGRRSTSLGYGECQCDFLVLYERNICCRGEGLCC